MPTDSCAPLPGRIGPGSARARRPWGRLLARLVAVLGLAVPVQAQLRVVNGDFSDLGGMTAGDDGWYTGVPAGWDGTANPYGVQVTRGGRPPTCNPSQLGFLRQTVGTLAATSDVTLGFDVSDPWNPGSVLAAAILDGDLVPLARGDFEPGQRRTLVARQVPAGTTIVVAFQAAARTPGLDDVSIATREAAAAEAPASSAQEREDRITVVSYYFGNYHPGDPRNAASKGEDWSEWELVRTARPRFPGHQQPKLPAWGYEDESDPRVMARKIDAAADHGIDVFLFDWYFYDDGPFLDRPIDRGFLQAANRARLDFALMWANHDWIELHPYRRGTQRKVLYPGAVRPETFERICGHLIGSCFTHPSYWRIDGRPYFSIYELQKLVESFGSVAATRQALDRFRARANDAGLPGLHLNAVVWGRPVLPGESEPADVAALVRDLGFDSVTSYVWVHHVGLPTLQTDYDTVRDGYLGYWLQAERQFDVPYLPNVTMGWDPSPRTHPDDEYGNFGYPFTNLISGNTPARFERALAMTRRRLLADPDGPRILNINCWNEWTEGSYLEPDQVHGMAYLEAVRRVFRPESQD